MTDTKTTADGPDEALPATAGKLGRPRLRISSTPATSEPRRSGMEKVVERLLEVAMRGEAGSVIGSWPVTSMSELRDAIDAAIEIVTEAGGTDIGVGRVDVVLAHFPRGEGKPYRVSIKTPLPPVVDA